MYQGLHAISGLTKRYNHEKGNIELTDEVIEIANVSNKQYGVLKKIYIFKAMWLCSRYNPCAIFDERSTYSTNRCKRVLSNTK